VQFHSNIANELGLPLLAVTSTIQLLTEGCTTPFLARYRKEKTHGMDEVQIEAIRQKWNYFLELEKRKSTILATISELGKLTPELNQKINDCWDAVILEDIYLPFRPKRRTKASVAREQGLEPLASWILMEYATAPEQEALRYLHSEVKTIDDALGGAKDIIAEIISEDAVARNVVRNHFEKYASFRSKMVKNKELEGAKYRDYFKFSESISRCPSHRVLAMFRGVEEGFLKLRVIPEPEPVVRSLHRQLVRKNTPSSQCIKQAIEDGYERLMEPSIENEYRHKLKAKADADAIRVFANNAQQLLMAPPLGNQKILAIDPGFRTGCKVVCLDEAGDLLTDTVIYPHEPQVQTLQAAHIIRELIENYCIQAIAIGNGTGGRETEQFIHDLNLGETIQVFMVNENGASIYSASEIAREEFPNKDITVRGAVSIGRRLADPLAELVKIDPKSIGVGQYQHDVDQHMLKDSLENVVEYCVNKVGVNLNSASKSLLSHVSGLNATVAQNIVAFRSKNGAFTSRQDLKKIPRLGEKTFEQCAAFLRIPQSTNPLDNSAVHPESYALVDRMANDIGCTIEDLLRDGTYRKQINPAHYVSDQFGLPTIEDILQELAKPSRDPRPAIEVFKFASAKNIDQLTLGMVLPGIVTNITKFSCFVDIGVKQDGMVHISQMADRYISDPNEVVKIQQHVQVRVLELDLVRKRISLSMRSQ
jgi:protein Tex